MIIMRLLRTLLLLFFWMDSGMALASVLPPVVPRTISTVVFPGQHSARLTHLDPEFRQQIEELILRMNLHGYRVRVESTYRSDRRQNWLYFWSQWAKNYGANIGFTNAPGGKSCHNMTSDTAEPAALAVDLWGFRYGPSLRWNRRAMNKHRNFFMLLGTEVKALELNWGETLRNSVWSDYGLGRTHRMFLPKCRWR